MEVDLNTFVNYLKFEKSFPKIFEKALFLLILYLGKRSKSKDFLTVKQDSDEVDVLFPECQLTFNFIPLLNNFSAVFDFTYIIQNKDLILRFKLKNKYDTLTKIKINIKEHLIYDLTLLFIMNIIIEYNESLYVYDSTEASLSSYEKLIFLVNGLKSQRIKDIRKFLEKEVVSFLPCKDIVVYTEKEDGKFTLFSSSRENVKKELTENQILSLKNFSRYKFSSKETTIYILVTLEEELKLQEDFAQLLMYFIAKSIENTLLFEKIKFYSQRDPLTSLYNRRFFLEELKKEILRAERYKFDFSLIMFDLDNFKKINDTYGHQIGDLVLKKFASLLKKTLRNTDIPARYGGEEFVILLPFADLKKGVDVAQRIRKAVEKLNIKSERGETFGFTVSGGVSSYRSVKGMNQNHASLTDALIHYADSGLYMAKRKGKNRIEVDPVLLLKSSSPEETTDR